MTVVSKSSEICGHPGIGGSLTSWFDSGLCLHIVVITGVEFVPKWGLQTLKYKT